jgi:hypothetical protein
MNRPNKIDALYDGLVVMYKAAGMSVKTVDPLPNQTLENFQKHAKASTTKFGRRRRKPHILRQYYRQNGPQME